MVFRSLLRPAKEALTNTLPGQRAAKGQRVVVLGSGWGGFQLVCDSLECSDFFSTKLPYLLVVHSNFSTSSSYRP